MLLRFFQGGANVMIPWSEDDHLVMRRFAVLICLTEIAKAHPTLEASWALPAVGSTRRRRLSEIIYREHSAIS
jgi:hypothetical protein